MSMSMSMSMSLRSRYKKLPRGQPRPVWWRCASQEYDDAIRLRVPTGRVVPFSRRSYGPDVERPH